MSSIRRNILTNRGPNLVKQRFYDSFFIAMF